MPRSLRVHRDVPDDIAEIVSYLHDRNRGAAARFPRAVMETAEALTETPAMGRIWRSANPLTNGVRSVTVRTFRNYLLFHRERADAVQVFLIIHGSRNWQRELADRLSRP